MGQSDSPTSFEDKKRKARSDEDELEADSFKKVKTEDGSEPKTNSSKPMPMDVEDLLRKKHEEESKKSKPVFLSKKEREALALQRRAQQVEEMKERQLLTQKQREEFFNTKDADKSGDRRARDRERERERDRDRDRRDRDRKKDREDREKQKEAAKEEIEKQKIKEKVQAQYLGLKKEQKKKVLKPSEKFKFVFDWDASDDTLQDSDSVAGNIQPQRPQFGRGFIAGIDKKEQIKEYRKWLSEHDRLANKEQDAKTVQYHLDEKAKLEKKLQELQEDERPEKEWRQKSLEEMTHRDWRIFKEEFNISSKGGNIPHPIRYWKEANLRKRIMAAIEKAGYKEPTPIQKQAIPIAMQGRDVMGIAETGSGKTAAFVIPMLEYILKLPKLTPETDQDGPYALIMAPTRELAVQIEQETSRFAKFCDLRCVCLVGGQSIEEQGMLLRRGCEIVIATPGRMIDCILSRYIVLNQCNYVVLDEADKMIDMGFEVQVNQVLEAMPQSTWKSEDEEEAAKQEGKVTAYRTTIMYSATMPVGVERLARKYLRRPAYVIIGEIGRAVDRIEQVVEWVSEEGKLRKLVSTLSEGPPPPIMIFVNKKKSCDGIAKHLEKLGWRTTTLHSGRSQMQREAAIEGFKAKKFDVLVATDVAGRGIDVPGVTHVINFDMPKTIDDYTHRIGRTGRAGLAGKATSFLTNDNTDIMYDLKQMLSKGNNIIPPELDNHPAAAYKPGSIPDKPVRRKDTIIYAK